MHMYFYFSYIESGNCYFNLKFYIPILKINISILIFFLESELSYYISLSKKLSLKIVV